MWTFEIVVILGMIAMNAVFAGYEIALAAVSLARLRVLDREKLPGAGAALYMKENIEASLTVVQIGITLFGAIAAATGGAGAEENFAPCLQRQIGLSAGAAEFLAIALIVIPLTAATIVFGELIPKVFALRNQEWLCLRLSPLMRWCAMLTRPAIVLFGWIVTGIASRAHRVFRSIEGAQPEAEAAELKELHAVTQLARASYLIGSREESIILSAVKLSRRFIRDIMLPADQINMLNADDSMADCLIAAHLYMHTRLPVTEKPGDPSAIIGYVNFKDIIALMRLSPDKATLRAILRPIPSLQETTSLAVSLDAVIRGHTHIALIRDASKRVVGMITLGDMLGELIGEIKDEYDRLPVHVVRSGPGWIAGGGISTIRLKDETGISLGDFSEGAEYPTLSDWVIARLGRRVRGGDIVVYKGLRVVVRKIRRGRVTEAQITLAGHAPGAD